MVAEFAGAAEFAGEPAGVAPAVAEEPAGLVPAGVAPAVAEESGSGRVL